MPCFDYEVVACVRCKEVTCDGYDILNNEVVCDECMTPQEKNCSFWKSRRIGEVILGQGADPSRENHVCSGFRIVGILDKGLSVVRVNACYLTDEPQHPWTLRWDQLEGFQILPNNSQMPLL